MVWVAETNIKGPPGPPGADSTVPGPPGEEGAMGPPGATGPKGDKGDTGAASTVPGPTGPTGATGAQGIQGVKGDTGAAGPTGATGATGSPGATGAQGVPGPAITTLDNPPASPVNGQMWYETDSGNTFIYYIDAGGAPGQWVQQNVGQSDWNSILNKPGSFPPSPHDHSRLLNGAGTASIDTAGNLTVGPSGTAAVVAGDITSKRANNPVEGLYYLGDQSGGARYLNYSSGQYFLNIASLTVGGGITAAGGGITASGNITANGTIFNSPGQTILQSNYNTIWLRPNVDGANQASLDTSGSLTIAGNVTIGGLANVTGIVNSAASVNAPILSVDSGVFRFWANPTNRYIEFYPSWYLTWYKADGALGFGSPLGTRTYWRPSDNMFIHYGPAAKPGGGAWGDSASDARVKTILGDYEIGLEAIKALHPVRYTFKGNDTPTEPEGAPSHVQEGPYDKPPDPDIEVHTLKAAVPYWNSIHRDAAIKGTEFVGFIAQEAEQVMPDMVTKSAGYIDGEPVTDLRGMDTSSLIFALVNAVQELSARLEAVEGSARGV